MVCKSIYTPGYTTKQDAWLAYQNWLIPMLLKNDPLHGNLEYKVSLTQDTEGLWAFAAECNEERVDLSLNVTSNN